MFGEEERIEVLEIRGGLPLNGVISVSGAKNAILPLMAGAVLTNKPVVFKNVPAISDVSSMARMLTEHGVSVEHVVGQNEVHVRALNPRPIPGDSTVSGRFRAVLLLGPLLARLGHVRVYPQGGDDIGDRPVDMHVANLESMGATVRETREADPPYRFYVEAIAANGLRAPRQSLYLPKVSVGATQNTIMAACVATGGTTTIENASIEPETLDLVNFLRELGAEIEVDKARCKIKITGKPLAHYQSSSTMFASPTIRHTVIPDRIVAGTYAMAAVITGGSIELQVGNFPDQTILELLESQFWRFLAAGVDVTRTQNGFRVQRKQGRFGYQLPISPVNIVTRPYPGFPTDLHPQWGALMCFSQGTSWIKEAIFPRRSQYIEQLRTMGATICRNRNQSNDAQLVVEITGDSTLGENDQPNVDVEGGDIRAGAALILAALARNGVTRIEGLDHLERGYEDLENKLSNCGARIERKILIRRA